jgi:hypothetical protein
MSEQTKLAKAVTSIIDIYDAGDLSFKEMALRVGLDPKRDFKGADLRGIDLSYEDLTDFDFAGADLTGANLYKAIFRISALAGARLKDAIIPDTIWIRPRCSAFSPSERWQPIDSQHALSLAHWSRREYLYQIVQREQTTALTTPVRWLPDSNFYLFITRDLGGVTRQAFYLQTPDYLWSLGGKLEQEKIWRRTSPLALNSENVVEYLALYLFVYAQAVLITASGLDDIEIVDTSGSTEGTEKYLYSFVAEPIVNKTERGFRIDGSALGVGTAYPISADITEVGRVRFDSNPVLATQIPVLVMSPDEDTDTLFADWASRR